MRRDPDAFWLTELRRIDAALTLRWDDERHCFAVARREMGESHDVFYCADEAGNPIEPGGWMIRYLRNIDTWRMHGGLRAFLRTLEDAAEKRRERNRLRLRDEARHGAREWAPYVTAEMYDGGFHHHSFSLIGAGE